MICENVVGYERSKESLVAFCNIDDLDLSVSDFRKDGEMMMVREVPGLDMELIEHIMMSDPVGPNLLQDCVLQLLMQDGMVAADYNNLLPVKGHVLIDHDLSVGHRIYLLNYIEASAISDLLERRLVL